MTNINSGTILLAFFAVLFGLAGTYAIKNARPAHTEIKEIAPVKPPRMVTVPMASRDIPAGSQILLDDVALLKLTPPDVRNRVKAKSFMTSPSQIIGKTARRLIKRGSTFDTQDFYPQGQRPGILDRLQPGQRAMTINVKPVHALLGFAGPGQRVDVLFHYGLNDQPSANSDNGLPPLSPTASPNSNRRSEWPNIHAATSTLVQNAEILALQDQSLPTKAATGIAASETVSITLAVAPKEAELLRVAIGHGELSLTLRPESDLDEIPLAGPVTLDKIIQVKNHQHEMEIYRGKQVSRLQFIGNQTIERRTFHSQVINGTDNVTSPNQSPLPPTYIPVPYPVSTQIPAPSNNVPSSQDSRGR